MVDRNGYLLIVDITGYTAYLSDSELEHAQQTLSSLLELLVLATPPPLAVAQLEGDAVMSYALDASMPSGQTFIESIESIYVEFRRALELMVINTTCPCNACANISQLDLKFFVHHGAFLLQPVIDREQLVGADVNFIHRLLKNTVTKKTGFRAYLMITEAARAALGIEPSGGSWLAHTETVADFGEVRTWIRDMGPAFEASKSVDRSFYTPRDVLARLTTEIGASREMVWDRLRDSDARNLVLGSDSYQLEGSSDGWVGEGSAYRCYHGSSVVRQLVVEWDPPRRLVLDEILPMPGKRPTRTIVDISLEASARDSTTMTLVVTTPTGPFLQRNLAKLWLWKTGRRVERGLHEFVELVNESTVAETGGHEAVDRGD